MRQTQASLLELIERPTRGKLIAGTGGARKMRFAIAGKGKSCGIRIIYYHVEKSRDKVMDEKLFEKLVESTKQAIEISEGKREASRTFSFEKPDDIKTIRNEKLHTSQEKFASMLGVSVRTLQEWEQGRRKPTGAAKSLLKVAFFAPEVVLRALSQYKR